ncbi:hypothetical protein L596_003393 [Steinernema carpocapsae]|uniref:Uncharacterized protein n=1 Tax=Steinernema carpocapsae TaxID=34508 RepID=A0A4U8USB0_STECR|nr:hypothetical protein L596_003393 [Steinernema carpocapsae]
MWLSSFLHDGYFWKLFSRVSPVRVDKLCIEHKAAKQCVRLSRGLCSNENRDCVLYTYFIASPVAQLIDDFREAKLPYLY